MTTAYDGPVVTEDQQQIVYLKERVDALTIDLATQRSIVDEHRRKVSRLFTQVNDYIEENDLDESDDMPLSELETILSNVFNHNLVFEKLYEVQICYTMETIWQIRAKDEESARDIAENIGVSRDPEFDHEEEPTECRVEESRVHYVEKLEK
jgi:hypothetical protein